MSKTPRFDAWHQGRANAELARAIAERALRQPDSAQRWPSATDDWRSLIRQLRVAQHLAARVKGRYIADHPAMEHIWHQDIYAPPSRQVASQDLRSRESCMRAAIALLANIAKEPNGPKVVA